MVNIRSLEEFKGRRLMVLNSLVAPDFGHLWAVVGVYAQGTEPPALLSTAEGLVPTDVFLVSFKTERLARNLGQVKDLAATSETILHTLRGLEEVYGMIQSEWKSAFNAFNSFFDRYSRKLNQLGGMHSQLRPSSPFDADLNHPQMNSP